MSCIIVTEHYTLQALFRWLCFTWIQVFLVVGVDLEICKLRLNNFYLPCHVFCMQVQIKITAPSVCETHFIILKISCTFCQIILFRPDNVGSSMCYTLIMSFLVNRLIHVIVLDYTLNSIRACALALYPPNHSIWIFTHLKLFLADAMHNFKWVKIIQISQNGGQLFLNLACCCHILSLTYLKCGTQCAKKKWKPEYMRLRWLKG